ncbi:hypothetical protein [Rhizobium favelukesii]|uniref:Conserved protein n=1 Tax=Rhizobium favelukesii TaxID=348824 RepID=W6R7V3_9HYPH|nr:hypothetical protein [Rhizobium favelukesii]MCS0459328.1 hypothetical protein [Rhizobium favelukesii]CDM57372.1 putative conserved protein [Rhizobium favelukesii]
MANDLLPVQIPPGVVRGATPLDAKGRWWDTNLVRWRNGVLEPIRGWSKIHATAFADRVRKLDVWRANDNTRFIMTATDKKIFSNYDGSFVDVTPAGLVTSLPAAAYTGFGVGPFGKEAFGTARALPSFNMQITAPYWSLARWGEDMLSVLSVDGKLYQYDVTNANNPFTAIAGAPVKNAAVHVTPERHAMLLQVGGNPRRVGWSSRENNADWNFASTTNTAGYLDLETSTPLLKAIDSRAGTLVFSSSDVFLMQYVGLPYVYGRQWLGKSRLLNPDTLVNDNGNVFWWSPDGFKMFDGGTIRTLDCPVWDYVMSRADLNYLRVYAHGGSMGVYPEIWFFYPSKESGGRCDSYVMFNYIEGWWAIGSLARSAMVGADADRFPYMAGEDNFVYRHEDGWSGEGRNVYAETSALTLGVGARTMDIKQALVANGAGYDSLRLRFYTNLAPEGAGREFGPYSPRPDGYTDARVSGRDIRVRFEATKDEDWSMGELRLDWSIGSGR